MGNRNNKGQFIKGVGNSGETFDGFSVYYTKTGYPCIYLNNKSILIHVLVWERENGEKPIGYDIHHVDFNKKNYKINNLSIESKSDHLRIHAGWERDSNNEWSLKPCKDCKELLPLDRFYQRKGLTPSNRCKICSGVYSKTLRTPDFIEKKKRYLKDYYAKNKK